MIRWKTFTIGWSLALALLLFAAHKTTMPDQIAYRDVVDLTHNLDDHSPNWEGPAGGPHIEVERRKGKTAARHEPRP